jgi:sulfur relay (sulfurtransferase) DsrC/TusE family protein
MAEDKKQQCNDFIDWIAKIRSLQFFKSEEQYKLISYLNSFYFSEIEQPAVYEFKKFMDERLLFTYFSYMLLQEPFPELRKKVQDFLDYVRKAGLEGKLEGDEEDENASDSLPDTSVIDILDGEKKSERKDEKKNVEHPIHTMLRKLREKREINCRLKYLRRQRKYFEGRREGQKKDLDTLIKFVMEQGLKKPQDSEVNKVQREVSEKEPKGEEKKKEK